MFKRIYCPAVNFIAFAMCLSALAEENWPTWRGPSGNGVSNAKGLPETWSETENIAWKTPLPSWSGSSPIVWDDKVFLMSPSKSNTDPAAEGRGKYSDPGGDSLLLLCISAKDGKVLWETEVAKGNSLGRKGNATSPSPVTDGEHVWTMTGSGALTAVTMDGKVVWSKNIQDEYGKFGLNFVYGSSPVVYDGKVFIQVLHGMKTDDPSYLAAFDGLKGDLVWRVERPTDAISETPDAYNTPALLKVGDQMQLIVCGGGFVSGHDLKDGKEIWRSFGLDPTRNEYYRTISSAVAVDGMVYAPTRQKPLLAVRADGKGDVSATHVAWKWDESYGPDVPTAVCDGKYFYMVDDKGVATCTDAKTGKVIWGPEHTQKGPYSASPVLANGKLYFTNEAGVTTVLSAGKEFKVIATNTLDGEEHTLSSFAVSDGRLYLRTPSFLYCIGK